MFNKDFEQTNWIMENKISDRFLKDLYKVRLRYTNNWVFCIPTDRVFGFMKMIHETYEKYYELTPKEIPSEKQEEKKEEG